MERREAPTLFFFRDICSPTLPLRKDSGVGGGEPKCASSAGPPLRQPPFSAAQRERKGQRMERGYDEGSFLKTHRVHRMGVGGETQAHISALALEAAELQRERVAPSSPPPQSRVPVGLSTGYRGELTSLTLGLKGPLSWEERARRSCQDQGWQPIPLPIPFGSGGTHPGARSWALVKQTRG